MNTAEMVALIRQGRLERGAYTVGIKHGVYSGVMGKQILIYTDGKPDSEILSFNPNEFLLVVESAKELPLESFTTLIMAKRMLGGTILREEFS